MIRKVVVFKLMRASMPPKKTVETLRRSGWKNIVIATGLKEQRYKMIAERKDDVYISLAADNVTGGNGRIDGGYEGQLVIRLWVGDWSIFSQHYDSNRGSMWNNYDVPPKKRLNIAKSLIEKIPSCRNLESE